MKTVEISDELYAQAEREATARGITMAELVAAALGKELPQSLVEWGIEDSVVHADAPSND